MVETSKEFSWKSPELNEAVVKQSGNFFKAERGKVYVIEIDTSKKIIDRGIVEIAGKLSRKFDISLIVEGKPQTWSVGKSNLDLLNKHIQEGFTKFKVTLDSQGYVIIPVLK